MSRRWGLAFGVMSMIMGLPVAVWAIEPPVVKQIPAQQTAQTTTATAAHQLAVERYRMGYVGGVRSQFEQARELYQAAGDRSGEARLLLDMSEMAGLRLSQSQQALELAEAGLAIAQDLDDETLIIDALIAVGDAYRALDNEAATMHYQQALTRSQAADYRLGEGRALLRGMHPIYDYADDAHISADDLQRGFEIIQAVGRPQDKAIAGLQLAHRADKQDKPKAALEALQQGMVQLQAAGYRFLFLEYVWVLSGYAFEQEQTDEVLDFFSQQVAIAKRNDSIWAVDWLHALGGLHQHFLEAPDIALQHYEAALESAQAKNDVQGTVAALALLGLFHERQDDHAQAFAYFEQGFRLTQATGAVFFLETSFLSRMASVGRLQLSPTEARERVRYFQTLSLEFQAAGDIDSIVQSTSAITTLTSEAFLEVLALAQDNLAIVRERGEPEQVAQLLEVLGQIYRHKDRTQDAVTYYTQALEIYQETENKAQQAKVLRTLGDLSNNHPFGTDNIELAIEFHRQALVIYRQLNEIRKISSSLRTLAHLYQKQGNYTEALRHYKRQLALHQSEQSTHSYIRETASILDKIARLYKEWEKYDLALIYYQRSLKAHRKNSDQWAINNTIEQIHELYREQGNEDAAIALYQAELAVLEKAGDQLSVARILQALGNIYRERKDYTVALNYYQQELEIIQEIESEAAFDRVGYMLGRLNDIADVYAAQEDYEKAIDYYQQRLELLRNSEDRVYPLIFELANIERVYRQQGRDDEVIAFYQTELERLYASEDEPHQQNVSGLLRKLGDLYLAQGNDETAFDYYQKNIRFHEARGDSESLIYAFQAIAMAHKHKEDLDEALFYYKQQLAAAEKAETLVIYSLRQVGNIYLEQEDYTKALEIFQRQLAIAQEQGRPREIASALHKVAYSYLQLEDYNQALAHYQQKLEIHQQYGQPHEVGESLRRLADLYRRQGDYAQALAHHQQQLAIARQRDDQYDVAEALTDLARLAVAQEQIDTALDYYQQSIATLQGIEVTEYSSPQYRLFDSLVEVGEFQALQDNFDAAITFYTQAIELGEQVRPEWNDDQKFIEQHGKYYERLAELLEQQGRVDEAKAVLGLLAGR
ncbi:MAG: tetratricopeptide repeat protein [Spirulina sp. SIO3F2]|nr:tetratricopeptide repeat protein [Spirulina sp. SIO3F2]